MGGHAVTVVVGAAVLAVALDGGGYSLGSRTALHAVVVAGILAALLSGGFRLGRGAALAALALTSLALVAVLSASWADDPETALAEGSRWALYASVFVLAAGSLRRAQVRQVADGLTLGIVAVALLALSSRAFPGLIDPGALPEVVPAVESRLSYPLQYWNGLGLLLAAGVLLLARVIADPGRSRARLAAVAGMAVVAPALYLTSSRAAIGAVAIGLVGLAALDGRPLAALRGRASARSLVGTAAAGIACALAAVIWLNPADRWDRFTAPPNGTAAADAHGFVTTHLFSGGGSGRWQFWSAALDQFADRPLTGGGSGSYAAWWTEHGTLPDTVRDAHGLVPQTLGELGLVGGALLVAFMVIALSGATRGALAAGSARPHAAALVAAGGAVLFGAQVDWSLNLPAVAVIALVALGVLAATAPSKPLPRATAVAIAVAAIAGLGASLYPWLVTTQITASRAAARSGDLQAALDHALAARTLQPWASSPRLQEALVRERAGEASGAAKAIAAAILRDPQDWRIRLTAARLQAAAGDGTAADASLRRAQRLAPRSAAVGAVLAP